MYLCRYGVAAVIEDVDLSGFDVIYCAANDDASFFRLAYVALRVLPEGVYAVPDIALDGLVDIFRDASLCLDALRDGRNKAAQLAG